MTDTNKKVNGVMDRMQKSRNVKQVTIPERDKNLLAIILFGIVVFIMAIALNLDHRMRKIESQLNQSATRSYCDVLRQEYGDRLLECDDLENVGSNWTVNVWYAINESEKHV